jgi:protein-S-isoprenylcysteine O-methyltransferase Ste14
MSGSDNAGVKVPPPICFFGFLMAGILIDSTWIGGSLAPPVFMIIGAVIAIPTFILLVISAKKHKSVGSNVEPWKPTTVLITDGVYKYTRNPIYVAMATVYIGLAIAAGSLMAIVLLPVCLTVIWYFVIAKEEAYLEDKFGDQYLSYKTKVRRWL